MSSPTAETPGTQDVARQEHNAASNTDTGSGCGGVSKETPEVVLVGKGADAKPITGKYCAAISEAIRLCDRCEWLGVNDVAAWNALTPDDLRKTRRLVLPTWLHEDFTCRVKVPWYKLKIPTNIEIHLYQLHTAPRRCHNLPYFGVCASTSDSLVAYLLHLGFRTFAFNGVGTNPNYHPMFKPRCVKSGGHFERVQLMIHNRIRKAKGRWRTWDE